MLQVREAIDNKGKQFFYHDEVMPCIKFAKSTAAAFVEKINEEVGEVEDETQNLLKSIALGEDVGITLDIKKQLGVEIVDVITVCHSYLYSLGFTEEEISELFLFVNKKNGVRGYFKEELPRD